MTWKTKRGIGMAYYVSLILNYQNICALKIKQAEQYGPMKGLSLSERNGRRQRKSKKSEVFKK